MANPRKTGRIRVRTLVDIRQEWVREDLTRDHVRVEHVAINREIASAPPIREEDGVTIIPVVEKVMVVERRLVLREEIHILAQRDVPARGGPQYL